MASDICTTPIPNARIICLSYVEPNSSMFPAMMNCLIFSGNSKSLSRLIPKKVPRTAPITVVNIPSVITRFIMPAMSLPIFFFNKKPRSISIRPYPASPIQNAKNNEKNGATIGVGSKSVPLGMPYIFVSTSYILVKALFFSLTGALSPRRTGRMS